MPRKELQYTQAFQKWMREFCAAAIKDNYAELLRPLEHLELKCSGEDALASTVSLVLAALRKQSAFQLLVLPSPVSSSQQRPR